jgi:hypothetical protein
LRRIVAGSCRKGACSTGLAEFIASASSIASELSVFITPHAELGSHLPAVEGIGVDHNKKSLHCPTAAFSERRSAWCEGPVRLSRGVGIAEWACRADPRVDHHHVRIALLGQSKFKRVWIIAVNEKAARKPARHSLPAELPRETETIAPKQEACLVTTTSRQPKSTCIDFHYYYFSVLRTSTNWFS